nr:MAG TPA: hypothetical protein [Caudoviricetes sp.]
MQKNAIGLSDGTGEFILERIKWNCGFHNFSRAARGHLTSFI